jgi:hypothetical protein
MLSTEDLSAAFSGFGYSHEDQHKACSGQCGQEHHDNRFQKRYVSITQEKSVALLHHHFTQGILAFIR